MARSFRSLLAFGLATAARLRRRAVAAALLQLLERGLALLDGRAEVAALLLVELLGLIDGGLQSARVAALDGVGNRYVVRSHVGHGRSFSFRSTLSTMGLASDRGRAHVRALQRSSRAIDDGEMDALLGIREREE